MHRLFLLVLSGLGAAAVACSPGDVRREAGHRAAPRPAPVAGAATATATSPATSPAESVLVTFLEHSREGHAGSHATADSLLGCGLADATDEPTEMLADFRLLRSRADGDTIVALVDAVTVAREESDARVPDRFHATQRVAEDTVEFRLTRSATPRGWVVCDGPSYGFWGADATTTWDPPGASRRTARALADSVFQARRRARPAADSPSGPHHDYS